MKHMSTYDTTAPYPRDLVGYGRNPPHAQWPGQARIAVQFVLNYEEGGENCVLHGDAGSEQFLSEMFNPASFPDRHISMEGIYEYGSRAGVWRILRELGTSSSAHGAFLVLGGQRLHDVCMFVVRMLGRARALIHERDQRASGDRFAGYCTSTALPMSSAMRT